MKRNRDADFVTAQDIVIPKGTPIARGPHTIQRGVPFAEAIIGVTKDTTAVWSMPMDEAMEAGLVVRA